MTPTNLNKTTRMVRHIRRLALAGALLGMAPAIVIAVLRTTNAAAPLSAEALLGGAAFALPYLSPYLVAFYVSRTNSAVSRAVPLLAAALASLLESFSSASGLSLVLLPATIVLAVAAVLAFRSPGPGGAWKAVFAAGAIGAAAFLAASFLVLFLRDDARCWQLTTYKDGRTEWQTIAVPLPGAGITVGPAPENAVRREARCSSDVITWPEALASLGILAVGLLALVGFSRYVAQAAQREVT